MANYFRYPFAVSGDMSAIPDTIQGDGSVSLQEGYGGEYSLDLRTNPDARAIERPEFNGIMNKVTGAIRTMQQNSGYPDYITAAENGGTAYSYPAGSRVIYSGALYQAKVTTTALPSDATKWDPVDVLSGVAPLTITNAQIKANAAIDASKIANGTISNTEFQYLNGVTSAIQTQLNAKQPTGAYITSLTGDVIGSGAGAAPTQLSTTGVAAGFYPNANLTVDAKGRITSAAAGPSAFDLYDSFEIWSGGMPQGWTSAQSAQINESSLHVTQGTKSVNLNASGAVEMTKTVTYENIQNFGEFVLDVFIGSIGAGETVYLQCGSEISATPLGEVGTHTLRVSVVAGAADIKIGITGAGSAYVDNLRSVLKVFASGVAVVNTSFANLSGNNAQLLFEEIDEALSGGTSQIYVDTFFQTADFTSGVTVLTLSQTPLSEAAVWVSMDGINQQDFSLDVDEVTLTVPSTSVEEIQIKYISGVSVSVGTPSDTTVTYAKTATSLRGVLADIIAGAVNKFATCKAVFDYSQPKVNRAYQSTNVRSVITAAIPLDDTIPQITEGAEVLSLNFTPQRADSKVRIHVSHTSARSASGGINVTALFRGANTDAIAANGFSNAAGYLSNTSLIYIDEPNTTDEITYSVRFGPNSGTAYFNGGTTDYFGGTFIAFIEIEEVFA